MVQKIIIAVLTLSTGIIIGNYFTGPYTVDAALAQAHEYLYKEVSGNGALKQTDLTELSGYALQIAKIRLRLLDTEDIEWHKKYDAAMKKTSDFDGGSLELSDLNIRGYELVTARIKELKEPK
jgi:uncharacterized protein YecT (DUF1311 family)